MLCRLCIYDVNEQESIQLFCEDNDFGLSEFIEKYLHIEITKSGNSWNIICKKCNQHLKDFHEFFRYIEQRQRELPDEFIKVEPGNLESLSDNKYDDLEREKSEEPLAIAEIGFEDSKDNLVEVIKPIKKEKGLKAQRDKSEFPKCKTRRCSKRIAANKKEEIVTIQEENSKDLEKSSDPSTETLSKGVENRNQACLSISKQKNEIIAEYMQLKCDICQEAVSDMSALRYHFRQKHNRKAYATCCGRRFHRRFLLVDHIQVHLNPEYFKCSICNKVFKTRVNLEMHNANMHIEKNELKYPCTLCDRRFAHNTNLVAHMTSHCKERNYQCGFCNKAFKSSNVLKVHIRSMHEKITPNICDICGKEYKSKSSFDRHTAEHQGQPIKVPKKQCKICGKSFSIFSFSRHTKSHENINIDCEKCGKNFKSKASFNYHMVNSHDRKRNFSCTICNKTFLRLEYLKEHINRHTGEKLYSCTYCSRDFRSKSSMYGHVKRLHFDDWKQAKSFQNKEIMEASTDATPEATSGLEISILAK